MEKRKTKSTEKMQAYRNKIKYNQANDNKITMQFISRLLRHLVGKSGGFFLPIPSTSRGSLIYKAQIPFRFHTVWLMHFGSVKSCVVPCRFDTARHTCRFDTSRHARTQQRTQHWCKYSAQSAALLAANSSANVSL